MGLLSLSPKYFNITSNFVIFMISTWLPFGDFQVTPVKVLCLTSSRVAHTHWERPSALHLRHERKTNPGSLLEALLCSGLCPPPSSPHLHWSLWPTLPCHYFSLSFFHFYSPVFETKVTIPPHANFIPSKVTVEKFAWTHLLHSCKRQ